VDEAQGAEFGECGREDRRAGGDDEDDVEDEAATQEESPGWESLATPSLVPSLATVAP